MSGELFCLTGSYHSANFSFLKSVTPEPLPPAKKGGPRERILTAGRRLFFSQGFEKVSTDLLAREASVSKTSIYKYFDDMPGVLRAVVEAAGAEFEAGFSDQPTSPEMFHEMLERYGTQLLSFLNKPEIIQFSKLMFEEARAHPDIAKVFYDAAYGRTHRRLTDFMAHGKTNGWLVTPLTAAEAAEALINLWEGLPFVRANLSLTDKPYPRPAARAKKCVRVFLSSE
ncbi:MAG: TetR/AcrR family transcriptional regulator [Verrucomicrobiota bacterium]